MTVYNRAELTTAQLAAWEEESRGEWVIVVAPSRAAMVSSIATRFDLDPAAVLLDDCGNITLDGAGGLRWREVVGSYQAYFPARTPGAKVTRGPW